MEKKNTSLIITIIILVICVIGLSGYIVYDKVYLNKQDDTSNIENKDNKPIDNKLSNEEVEKIGKNLFSKTLINTSENSDLYFLYNYFLYNGEYKTNLNYDKLDNKIRLEIAMIYYVNTYQSDYINKSIVKSESIVYNEFDKIDYENAYKEIFGNNKKINYETFDALYGKVTISNNKLILERDTSEGAASGGFYTLEYRNGYIDNNEIVINVRGYYHDYVGGKVEDNYYKLTFKQDTNGDYYWYSTELVK